MNKWNTIDELRMNFTKYYTQSTLNNTLEQACSGEYELVRDYNGRQILELLQNVDDAYGEKLKNSKTIMDENVEVSITYKDNILSVGNTGTMFTKETFERLCQGRASNKGSHNIGNKGTGFRSLLNDAEWIELQSGDFSAKFSEDFANKCFSENKDNELIQYQLNAWTKDYPLVFPVLNCPEDLNISENEFDTLIRIKVRNENDDKGSSSIKHQLSQPFYKSLLFLPNIKKITIETEGNLITSEKIIDGSNVYIERTINGEVSSTEEYLSFKKKVSITRENFADIIIAVPLDMNYDFSKEKIYCYFPIRNFRTPLNVLIHAPFSINDSRDSLPQDSTEINKILLISVLEYMREVVEDIVKMDRPELAIRTITTRNDNQVWTDDGFDLLDYYYEILSDAKIFKTVNNDYISILEEPKLFNHRFPKIFVGNSFKKLLKYYNSKAINDFIEKLAWHNEYHDIHYYPQMLNIKINDSLGNWSTNDRVHVFIWWSIHYKAEEFFPELLLDSTGKGITPDDRIFLPTDGGFSVLPDELKWVNLCILEQSYVEELVNQLKVYFEASWLKIQENYSRNERTGNKRILAAYSSKYFITSFTEQSSSEQIIRVINNQIDNHSKATSFLNWFFREYNERLKENSELSKIHFNLPTTGGEVVSKEYTYMGDDLGNSLCDKLFLNTDYRAIQLIEGLSDNETDEFVNFLTRCGVIKYRIIKNIEMRSIYSVREQYDIGFSRFLNEHYDDIASMNLNYLYTWSIENFEILIDNLETIDIVEWFKKDQNLLGILYTSDFRAYAQQQSNGTRKWIRTNDYIKFILNTHKWIMIDDVKYSPNQIITYENLGTKVPELIGVNMFELTELVGKDLYGSLGFREKLSDYNDTQIFELLKQLPNSIDSGVISRKLYLEIVRNKIELTPVYNSSGLRFLCKDGQYHNVDDVRYADKKLPRVLEGNSNFLALNEKLGTKKIKNWFGVEKYKSNFQLESYRSNRMIEEDFSDEINDIKVSVQSTIDDNATNVRNMKKIKIIPCEEIVVIDLEQDNKVLDLDNYYYVEKHNVYYLKIPNSINEVKELRNEDEFCLALVDLFRQALTLELKGNLIELLISKNKRTRKNKIASEFSIDRWNESYKLLFGEDYSNVKLIQYLEEKNVPQKQTDNISSLDFSVKLDKDSILVLIENLCSTKIDISDINIYSEFINIDIRNFWFDEVVSLKEKSQISYENKLLSSLIKCSFEKQKEYLLKIDQYYRWKPNINDMPNSIYFNVEMYLSDEYPELNLNKNIQIGKDIYEKNYTIYNPNDNYEDDIANNDTLRTYIYFNHEDKFKSWMEEKDRKIEDEKKPPEDEYGKYKNVVPTEEDIVHSDFNFKHNTGSNRRGSYDGNKHRDKLRNQKEKGNIGERLIYNMLCAEYGIENVHPNSEAFVEMKILKSGQASSGDYDISYYDENGDLYYAEVKAWDNVNGFTLTPGEYKYALEHPNNYKIFLVTSIDVNDPKFKELPLRFWEKDEYRIKQVIEKIEITF